MRSTFLLLCTIAISVPACDRTAGSDGGDVVGPATAALGTAWTTPVSIDPGGSHQVNTPMLEGCPNESTDGRSLYFATNRTGGQIDIWVASRDQDGDWVNPRPLPSPVNSSANDFCPTALPGGGLMFVSARADGTNCGTGTTDIYFTSYHSVTGWKEPVNLGCQVNSAGNEFSPSYVAAAGGMLYFSSDLGGKQSLYVSYRTLGGDWRAPQPINELNLAGYNTARPNVSADGREIVFDSDRPGVGMSDIWYANRRTPNDSWSVPVNLASVNSTGSETRAALSRDGKRLYLGSTIGGNPDLYVSTRQ